ncbi:hypothetical protein GCM10010261_65420 [Streptomyces pilosus]|nr:hypothetical protein GCM10010261_65420 [Streptomyces pilosus]
MAEASTSQGSMAEASTSQASMSEAFTARPAPATGARPSRPHAAGSGQAAGAGGERPSPTGTAPPRTPTLATAPAPSPGGRGPGAAGPSRRPADNRPAGRAARGRRPASPAAPGRGSRTAPAPGRAPLVVPRATDGSAGRPVSQPVQRPAPPLRPTDRFAELLLAVLSGQRPVHAMLRHTAGQAYDELIRLAERGPLRTRGARPVVRDIGWFEPREGAIEAFARIGAGDRLRAMAFRLERGRDLRWRCTAVELGGPRPRRAGTR